MSKIVMSIELVDTTLGQPMPPATRNRLTKTLTQHGLEECCTPEQAFHRLAELHPEQFAMLVRLDRHYPEPSAGKRTGGYRRCR